ncbi:MAG: alpha/beta hydrolase, partial [Vicinamibacterales bacterium]
VLIDQRGTGGSNSLDCTGDAVDDDLLSMEDYPIDRYRECLDRLDADPRLYTTAMAMDDIDEVRRYLGYGEINLWGGSYGTRAALVYLKRHDASVRTAVLDGVAPPDMRLPLFAARDSQRALDRLIADCSRDAGCARRFPDLSGSVVTVWARVAERPQVSFSHPRTGEVQTITITPRLLGAVVFQSLYSPELSALLPRLLTDAAAGQYQGLLALAFTRDIPKGAMSDGMFLSVVCAEDMPRIGEQDIARETAGRFLGATLFETQVRPCEFWPRGDVPPDYYAPLATSRPVLMFSGDNDPVTPPSWGEHVLPGLSHARHLVVPGAGHITLTHGCVPDLVAAFLASANVAALNPSCLEALARPPFFTSYTGPELP